MNIYSGDEDAEYLTELAAGVAESPLSIFLSAAADTLRYLDLGAVDLMRPEAESEGDEDGDYDIALSKTGHNVVRLLLFSIRFPVLKHFKLNGWVIRPDEFLQFLETMKGTLDYLELNYNIIHGVSSNRRSSKRLAQTGGAQMSLKGIRIDNYELENSMVEEDEGTESDEDRDLGDMFDLGYDYVMYGRDSECERMWLQGRVNMLG